MTVKVILYSNAIEYWYCSIDNALPHKYSIVYILHKGVNVRYCRICCTVMEQWL